MHRELPQFRKVKYQYAASLINAVLTGPQGASLSQLIEYDDHHFSVIFRQSYFQLGAGATSPSKSQWNTLKKKLKRRNRLIFVFREYGKCDCEKERRRIPLQDCFYLDFGFLFD